MAARAVNVSFKDETLAKLDAWRASQGIRTRSAAIKALVEGTLAEQLDEREEAVEMLRQQARGGSVSATIALVRHYDQQPVDPIERRLDEIARARRRQQRLRDQPGVG